MNIIQATANGLLLGGIYGGFAIGLSLLLGVLRIVNLAHSAVLMLGALVYWQLVAGAGMDPLLMIVPVVIAGYGFGWVVHAGIGKRIERSDDSTVMLAFFGIMVVLESVAIIAWSTDNKTLPLGYLSGVLQAGELYVPVARLVAAGLAAILLIGLHLFLSRTLTGSAIRGLAENRDVARMVGINVGVLTRRVFAVSIALAAFGGTILALTATFAPQEHLRWLAWSFLIVMIGGLGSVLRTFLAGLAVGLFESLVGTFVSFQYTYLALYLVLAIVMLVRSERLGGVRQRSI